MKLALVKQDVYPDLYITDSKEPLEILKSSMGRVGPIGLFTRLEADFYIVKEESTAECQFFRKVLKFHSDQSESFKNQLLNEIPGQEFKQPGSAYPNSKFAVQADSVDWGIYDIVISLNIALPTSLIKKYPETLFAYMIGEANKATFFPKFQYDVTLNQETHGRLKSQVFSSLDFPYTFVGGDCLHNLMKSTLNREPENEGIYSEINMSTERPVSEVPKTLSSFKNSGFKIRLHKQNIFDNLKQLFDAKYFIKAGGRVIRGNSVIEAISCGTLVLVLRNSIFHKNILPPECYFADQEGLKAKIAELEVNQKLYNDLLRQQQLLVEQYCFQKPYNSLTNCLDHKRSFREKSIQKKVFKLKKYLLSIISKLRFSFKRALR